MLSGFSLNPANPLAASGVINLSAALKAKTVVGETKGECPSAYIEITEEDGAFSFKGMNEPTNNKDCKKNSLQLHPDRNLGCKDEAKVKIQKVGGVNPFKSLVNIIDNAADKFTRFSFPQRTLSSSSRTLL